MPAVPGPLALSGAAQALVLFPVPPVSEGTAMVGQGLTVLEGPVARATVVRTPTSLLLASFLEAIGSSLGSLGVICRVVRLRTSP